MDDITLFSKLLRKTAEVKENEEKEAYLKAAEEVDNIKRENKR